MVVRRTVRALVSRSNSWFGIRWPLLAQTYITSSNLDFFSISLMYRICLPDSLSLKWLRSQGTRGINMTPSNHGKSLKYSADYTAE